MPPFLPVTLVSPRLVLRWLTQEDIPRLYAIFSHAEVMRFWGSPPWSDEAQAVASLTGVQEDYATGSAMEFGVERRSDGLLLGTCTLFHFNWPCRRAEMGYALGRDAWGHGYMNEALHLLVNYAFGELELHRLEADIDPRNAASARTLERLGFRLEGLLRERWIVAGEISDTGFYGLLRREWTEVTPLRPAG